ncbi:HSF-type DNA-binding-domain-containing protein [Scheffersomyces xylosifermentans]|uniref:HSF-type DNA-binding-domain-containing protein n=1 Tax=Scheffersomyces xylosifermentans TaxID=1304137 RepID=UPI00315DBEB9
MASVPIKQEASLSAPNAASVASTASSNQSGSNDFVKKLFLMLQEESYKDVVRWTTTGDSFVVLNTNEFTKEILPRHFKHSNFASFVRQLNKYDFHKVKIPNEEKQTYLYGEDAWEFKHPDFKINDRSSLENIKRKGPSTKKVGPPASVNGNEGIRPSSGTCNHNFSHLTNSQNHMKEQIDQLKADNKALHQDINILQTKYKTLIENIVAINTVDERYHRSMGVLVNCLLQAGIKLPPLDFPNSSLMNLQQPPRTQNHNPQQLASVIPTIAQPSISQAQHHQSNSISHLSPTLPSPNGARLPQVQQPIATAPTNSSNISVAPTYLPQGGLAPPAPLPTRQTPPNDTITPKQHSPLVPSTAGSPQTSTTTLANPKFHVLLVEDDNVCIQLCRKFLVKYGCQVTVVTDGLNAISTVEHTKYDLVLMDIVMPNLDGATATSVIRSFDTKTPIIAMTGNIEDNDLVTYLQNGMSDILAKPFTKDDLYSILSKHLLTDDNKTGIDTRPGRVSLPVAQTDVGPPPTNMNGLQSNESYLSAESDDPLSKKPRLQ